MRTTINLPDDLVNEAMHISNCRTKTTLFTMALKNIILQNQLAPLKKYKGKLKLDLNLDELRQRKK